ncbi:MAG: Cof-type HAD-IIB family hydrolase [Oscillospiraceae bacterium]|jgi:Cof subfamily protein (haloacid dehalogenase superfamily)|nr:Cof-type HAD-IIB family hydrolase [Oscillospiraceae bacterium]
MEDYKLIAMDLDGTLTTSKKKISPATQETLLRAQHEGVRLALVSGRPTPGVLPLARQLQMDRWDGYIVSFNGAKIVSCKTGNVLYERYLPQELLPRLCGLNKKHPLVTMVYSSDTIVTETPDSQYARSDGRINHMPIEEVPNLLQRIDFHVNKFLFAGDPEYIANLLPSLRREFPTCSIYCSEPYYLEVMPNNVDKGQALSVLLGRLGLNRSSLLACGDGFNDISMVRFAGMGVAMENAQPPVKEAADFVTRTNDNDGVAYAVQKFIFHKT